MLWLRHTQEMGWYVISVCLFEVLLYKIDLEFRKCCFCKIRSSCGSFGISTVSKIHYSTLKNFNSLTSSFLQESQSFAGCHRSPAFIVWLVWDKQKRQTLAAHNRHSYIYVYTLVNCIQFYIFYVYHLTLFNTTFFRTLSSPIHPKGDRTFDSTRLPHTS